MIKLLGAEVRQDWSNKGFLSGRNGGSDSSQTTLALQVLYTF